MFTLTYACLLLLIGLWAKCIEPAVIDNGAGVMTPYPNKDVQRRMANPYMSDFNGGGGNGGGNNNIDGAENAPLDGQLVNNPMMTNNERDNDHLLTQREINQLITDHLSRMPFNGKFSNPTYWLKPTRELNIATNPNLQFLTQGDETLRARRYAQAKSNQNFLRFGRRYKRPKETKDTAFLRFGRGGNMIESTMKSSVSGESAKQGGT